VLAVGLTTATLGFAGGLALASRSASRTGSGFDTDAAGVVLTVRTARPMVALSFDDGPDPRWTPQVLAILRSAGDRATFFDVGRNVDTHPELVQAEVAAGDEIGDHTWSHADLRRLPASGVMAEIERGADAIVRAGAPRPQLFRPPYGLSDDVVAAVADANHYRTVFWNLALERFVNHDPDLVAAVDRVLALVHPGTILLAHDGGLPNRSRTMHALPLLLAGLKSRGLAVTTVGDLLQAVAAPAPPVARGVRS
jgi:peptidoglycan/xylan/chitin deacetylase (PgdA/CDA1 family)